MTENLAAISAPEVIDMTPPADVLRAAVLDALPLLRDYIQTLEEWEQQDDAVAAMATVDHLARLAEQPTVCPVDTEATARLWYADHRMHLWDRLSPSEQQERAGIISRALILVDTPLVKDAQALDKLANDLHVGLTAFRTKYDRQEAGRLLTAAGLHDPHWKERGESGAYRETCFDPLLTAVQTAGEVVGPVAKQIGRIVGFLEQYQFGWVEPVRKTAA